MKRLIQSACILMGVTLLVASRGGAVGQTKKQDKTNGQEAFEVATIKPSAGGPVFGLECNGIDSRNAQSIPLGRCVIRNVPAIRIIAFAYDISFLDDIRQAISGGPGWIESDRYDIEAKAEEPVTELQLKLMLQSLLADQFKLEFHRVSKEVQGYTLVVAKNGPKLSVSSAGTAPGFSIRGGGNIQARSASMGDLAGALKMITNGPVVDRTGLNETYDFTLKWSPDKSELGGHGSGGNPSGPTLFTALQEQLGLKLESQKAPGDILVIDHVEKPLPNKSSDMH